MNGAINILKKWQKICDEPRQCADCPLYKPCPCARKWSESGVHSPLDWTDDDILKLVRLIARYGNE